ncbi:MAG: hypothetical protein FD123_3592 [Bacteroidetes bacterium]|nr:MAG: hypothetical protein FD123_3592 [Bacteroidota bacterium]
MKNHLFTFLFFLSALSVSAQEYPRHSKHYRSLSSPVFSPADTLLLATVEVKLWKKLDSWSKSKTTDSLFTPRHGHYGQVLDKQDAATLVLSNKKKPATPTGVYRLSVTWDRDAKNAELTDFAELFKTTHHDEKTREPVSDSTALINIPLFQYAYFLDPKEFTDLVSLVRRQFAMAMMPIAEPEKETFLTNSILYKDSDTLLPQSGIEDLGYELLDAARWGKIPGFENRGTNSILRRTYIDSVYTYWDSTNLVEDPNNPGTYIMVPIKLEPAPDRVLCVYAWEPYAKKSEYKWEKGKIIYGYRRETNWFVLEFNDKPAIWIQAYDALSYMEKDNFPYLVYRELFLAALYRQAGIGR